MAEEESNPPVTGAGEDDVFAGAGELPTALPEGLEDSEAEGDAGEGLGGLEDDDLFGNQEAAPKSPVEGDAAGVGPSVADDRRARMEALNAKFGAEEDGDGDDDEEEGEDEGKSKKDKKKKKKKKKKRRHGEDGEEGDEDGKKKKKKKKKRDRDETEEERKARRKRKKEEKRKAQPDGDVPSEDEDVVETAADREFIDDASADEEDARWKGGDSEDEDAPRAPEAEEGSEGEAMEVPARKKGGGGGKGAGNNERYVLPTLDANLKKLFQDALTSKPKKSKLVEEEEAKAKDIVRVFMVRMEEAARFDTEQNRKGKPAFKKLAMLDEVVEKLGKKHLQDQMLADGLLSNLKLWLELLPNGSLPNVQIRTALLRCLQSLHIDLSSETRRDQIKQSQLATVVMFLSKCPDETPENRRMAADLVLKWFAQLGWGSGGTSGKSRGALREEHVLSQQEKERRARMWAEKQKEKVKQAMAPTGIAAGGKMTRYLGQSTEAAEYKIIPTSDISQDAKRQATGRGENKDVMRALKLAQGKGKRK